MFCFYGGFPLELKTDKIFFTEAQESISSVAKSALDQIVEVGQNLQQQVKQTLEEHENGHKKQ